jgi:Tol biopolymer transport system component/TolB-like protein
LNSSELPATASALNAAESNSSNFNFQTENRNGDERPAANKHPNEEQSQKTTDRIENPKSQIPNPKSNVVALAAWRHEAETDDYQASAAEPAANEIHEGLQTNAIAVLPFKLIAVAAGDEYLGVGMADALIVSLSKIGDLQVRPTASVVPFAMSSANPIEAGRELKVEAILDGKIHQSGDNLRVNLQLIRVADGSLLWAEKFDGAASGIFRLEDEIAAFVAQKLRRDLDENTLRLLTTRGTKLLAAYQAFLKARFHFHQGSPEDYQKSNAFYSEAIRLDPSYAQAYAGLADVYILEVIFNLRRPQDAFAQVKQAVTKAVELDPTSAEVYAAHAHFNMCFNRDLAEAGRSARKAVELDPYSANAHNLLGQSLMFRGFYAEGEIALKQALEIDPLGFWHSCALTVCYFLWRKHQIAIRQSLTTAAINPKLYAETIKRCWSLTELGRHAEAFALYEEVSTQPGGETVIWFVGNAYAVAGETEKARAVLARLKEISAEMYLSPYFFALLHAGLNETQEAIDYLEQAVENRDPWMVFIYADPRLDNLRSDSRFQRLTSLVVPEAVRMKDNNLSTANLTTSSEPNQNSADSTRGERKTRTISATAIKSRKSVRLAAACVALLILASLIGYALYKFANSSPMIFEAQKTTRITATGKVKLAAISPDGKLIAYAQEENGEQQSLWIRHITSESSAQILLPSPVEYRGLDISPDGNWLYYIVGQGSLYRMPVLGGAAKKIADELYTSTLADADVGISPDGKQIAFVRRFEKETSALFLVNADGTGERTLAAFEQPIRLGESVAWSPDGKVIVCRELSNGYQNALAVQVADGTSAPILPKSRDALNQITWMPDSKSLLMIDVSGQIYQIFYPGGETRQINIDADQRIGIGLTADARILATVKTEIAAHIWTMPGSGDASRAKQLTAGFEKEDGLYGLSWMPDGRVVYDSYPNDEVSIWAVDASGGNSKQISKGSYNPTVSPDGHFIVYRKNVADSENSLWQMEVRSGGEKLLTNGVDVWQTFSPDGRWLVFTRFAERVGLWKIPSAGGEPTLILDENAICPAVSSDGKTVAFILRRAGEANRIALASFDGGEIIKTFDAKLEKNSLTGKQNLQWTTDGRGVYFVALTDGVSNIWQQPIDGSAPVQITNFTTGRIFNFAFSADGSQLALSHGTLNSDVVLIENQK